ncbi:hypothetical protein BTE48_07525 [Oceanospirillum multiglobuliferum]|uniref:Uroporphyrinogen-III synthase n=3 Tax=Oceanospirillum TaxID=965 RepID=A0A1V4T5A6_9GAMM|nr:hypothetical protein BTE48_07525 [Oceanospirillum multiglobuliferum]
MSLLQQAGAQPFSIPLLAIESLPESHEQRTTMLNLDLFHKVICISPNAAQLFLERMDQYWPQPPIGIQWVTPGQGSAKALEQWGLPVVYPTEGDNSEAMLNLPALQKVSGEKILLCKGESGRELLHEQLCARGAQVTLLPLYRRVCPALLAAEREILQEAEFDVVMISSSDALKNLVQCVGSSAPALFGKTILVSSPRLRLEARALGFKKIVQARGAGTQWQLAALATIASQR